MGRKHAGRRRVRPARVLLDTIPGVAELLASTIAVEVGEISRFAGPDKLVSYAVEAAQQAWRESNPPGTTLYTDVARRSHNKNSAKAAVARKILIAAWHMLSRNEPFNPAPRTTSVPASSRFALAA
jgi:transposase